MDLSRYTFQVKYCSSSLDEIEARLGVKFDRKAMFDLEEELSKKDARHSWFFRLSIDPTSTYASFFIGEGGRESAKVCPCGNHVEYRSPPAGYPSSNGLEMALYCFEIDVHKIQALRKPQPSKETPVDLSVYNFYAKDCAERLDKIESELGVKFDRKAMFDREQALRVVLHTGITRRQWVFKFSKDPSVTVATFDGREPIDDRTAIKETSTHIECTISSVFCAKDALAASLGRLQDKIPEIQALRKPQTQNTTMRTLDKSDRDQIAQNVKTINQNLRANLDPAAIIAAYEQTPPSKPVGIAVTIPADFNQPATFEVKSGSGTLPSCFLPLSDRLILTTVDREPRQNTNYLAIWSTDSLCTEWLQTNRLPPSDGVDELVAELIETCSRDKQMRVKYILDGQVIDGEYGDLKKNAETIRAIHKAYAGKSCALDIGFVRQRDPNPCRGGLCFRLQTAAPPLNQWSTSIAYNFEMHSDLKATLRELIRRIKESGQG